MMTRDFIGQNWNLFEMVVFWILLIMRDEQVNKCNYSFELRIGSKIR